MEHTFFDKENREKIEDIMAKYFLVDEIRTTYGGLDNSLNYKEEINRSLPSREKTQRNRVSQMSDQELLEALIHSKTGSESIHD